MRFRTSLWATVLLGGNACALVGLPVLLRIVVVLHTGCRRDRWKASRREITAHREWSRRRCDRAAGPEQHLRLGGRLSLGLQPLLLGTRRLVNGDRLVNLFSGSGGSFFGAGRYRCRHILVVARTAWYSFHRRTQ